MRRMTFILTTCLSIVMLAHGATVYRDSVKGFQSASGENDGVSLLLNAEGDLPGTCKLLLRREGDKVIGGNWTLTVFPPDADPTANEKGRLTGSVMGGALTFNSAGSLAAADSVLLTIEEGTGQYSRVKSGSATLNISSSAENPSQLTGTLILNF
jgi:hypothetical protein